MISAELLSYVTARCRAQDHGLDARMSRMRVGLEAAKRKAFWAGLGSLGPEGLGLQARL